MEGETTVPEKIYDMDTDKMVDNPAYKKPEYPTEEHEEEEQQPDPKKKPEAKAEKEKEEEESEEEQEESEAEEEQEEEEEEEEEPDPKKKPAKKEEEYTPDAYVEATFGEKFGIKTEADLIKIIENGVDANTEVKSLKEKIASAGEPKFTDPQKQAAFELVSKFNPKMQGEALQTFAKLITMNVDDADPMMVLQEKFVHENPHYTRADAERMFKRHHDKMYNLKREDFDTDEAFEEEKADLETMKRGDIAKGRTFLKDLQQKHKPAEAEGPKINEAVTKAVEKNAREYSASVEKLNEFSYNQDGFDFKYKLDAEKKKAVLDGITSWVKNPSSYDEKGTLIGAGSPEEMINTFIGGMFMTDILKSVVSQIKNQADGKRIEDLGGKKPIKRKAPASGSGTESDDLDAQARVLIRKKQAA